MSLAQSSQAIGAVSRWVSNRLTAWVTGANVTVGRPEQAATAGTNPKLNLFLYETSLDASLRNVPLDDGQPPPLWFVLKYLLTAFDSSGNSDTADAHDLVGRGMSALQELSYLPLSGAPANIQNALHKNPEPLKITFDEVTADLLSKIMQGPDEKYRFSIGFQIRPVMIAPPEPPSYALLVGVDYTTTPPTVIGEAGRKADILPSLGIGLDDVLPKQFEVNSTISLAGTDLHLSSLQVFLGPAALAVTPPSTSSQLNCLVNGSIAAGTLMSAGSHPLYVRQTLPSGRFRSSNLLIGNLLPTLTSASSSALVNVGGGRVRGHLQINGQLLGAASDDVLVAFYRNGAVERMFDDVTSNASQTQLNLSVATPQALPSGNYRIILRVNGQQARNSPEVAWIA
jgi:Pvc16 N-terminal domain